MGKQLEKSQYDLSFLSLKCYDAKSPRFDPRWLHFVNMFVSLHFCVAWAVKFLISLLLTVRLVKKKVEAPPRFELVY